MAALPMKRPREDNEDLDRYGLSEPKRARLPFRVSPTAKHTNLPREQHPDLPIVAPVTITPVESSDDDDNAMSHEGPLSPRHRRQRGDVLPSLAIRVHPCSDTNSDMEMTDTHFHSATSHSPWSSETHLSSPIPPHLITQSLDLSGGRTATPVHSHFTSNMNVDAMMPDSNNSDNIRRDANNNTLSVRTDWENLWRRRRLPSPISEDDISPTTVLPTPEIHSAPLSSTDNSSLRPPPFQLDSPLSSDERCVGNYLAHSKFGQISTGPSRALHHAEALEMSRSVWHGPMGSSWGNEHASASVSSRPKVSIAMGFRSDCDKCQQRVPGHYSHIIRI